ncbi:hypothetical protein GCM10010421_19820 [Streptomyces glaucus]|uniref:Secreted protein n=1 Tax=Streptomyces glaucus TaxID=284029 RepID=A0ABP5WNS9_9ACTN
MDGGRPVSVRQCGGGPKGLDRGWWWETGGRHSVREAGKSGDSRVRGRTGANRFPGRAPSSFRGTRPFFPGRGPVREAYARAARVRSMDRCRPGAPELTLEA